MKVSELIQGLSFILNDQSEVTYPRPDLISAINNGCRMVALMRPDSSSKIANVKLVAGAKQSLPDEALRLFDSCYCDKRPIEMINRKDLDRLVPDWMQTEESDQITEVMYDERVPHTFYTYPPAVADTEIELSYSIMPARVNEIDDDFPLIDKYVPPVMEWVLYLMFSRDSENSQNQQRAADHRQQFYNILQVKTSSDFTYAPKPSRPSPGQQEEAA